MNTPQPCPRCQRASRALTGTTRRARIGNALKMGLRSGVDYADAAMREFPESPRYTLHWRAQPDANTSFVIEIARIDREHAEMQRLLIEEHKLSVEAAHLDRYLPWLAIAGAIGGISALIGATVVAVAHCMGF